MIANSTLFAVMITAWCALIIMSMCPELFSGARQKLNTSKHKREPEKKSEDGLDIFV
tara:strand:+ start:395 stop:565 length:171 start_codon:yes stop_codon:yes gene_type:complete